MTPPPPCPHHHHVMIWLSPCCRTPRTEERNGVDYTFLSKDEFLALEKSGDLLESGVYDGQSHPHPPRQFLPCHPPRQHLHYHPPRQHHNCHPPRQLLHCHPPRQHLHRYLPRQHHQHDNHYSNGIIICVVLSFTSSLIDIKTSGITLGLKL